MAGKPSRTAEAPGNARRRLNRGVVFGWVFLAVYFAAIAWLIHLMGRAGLFKD